MESEKGPFVDYHPLEKGPFSGAMSVFRSVDAPLGAAKEKTRFGTNTNSFRIQPARIIPPCHSCGRAGSLFGSSGCAPKTKSTCVQALFHQPDYKLHEFPTRRGVGSAVLRDA